MAGPAPQASRQAPPGASRAALRERWQVLTRTILPGMAAAQRWPIRLDHCFMRVCLDAALGARWDLTVRRPAIRHLSDAQLARAVATAERVVADPASLRALNRSSLRMRGVHAAHAAPEPVPAAPRLRQAGETR